MTIMVGSRVRAGWGTVYRVAAEELPPHPSGERRWRCDPINGGGHIIIPTSALEPVSSSGLARNSDPDTSHAAPLTLDLSADRTRVLLTHAKHAEHGLTDFELAEIHGRAQTSLGKRRGELRDCGLIAATEARRPAPSGAMSTVWRITSDGVKEADQIMRRESV